MILPALQNLFLEQLESLEHVRVASKDFVAVKWLSGHNVAISR